LLLLALTFAVLFSTYGERSKSQNEPREKEREYKSPPSFGEGGKLGQDVFSAIAKTTLFPPFSQKIICFIKKTH